MRVLFANLMFSFIETYQMDIEKIVMSIVAVLLLLMLIFWVLDMQKEWDRKLERDRDWDHTPKLKKEKFSFSDWWDCL